MRRLLLLITLLTCILISGCKGNKNQNANSFDFYSSSVYSVTNLSNERLTIDLTKNELYNQALIYTSIEWSKDNVLPNKDPILFITKKEISIGAANKVYIKVILPEQIKKPYNLQVDEKLEIMIEDLNEVESNGNKPYQPL